MLGELLVVGGAAIAGLKVRKMLRAAKDKAAATEKALAAAKAAELAALKAAEEARARAQERSQVVALGSVSGVARAASGRAAVTSETPDGGGAAKRGRVTYGRGTTLAASARPPLGQEEAPPPDSSNQTQGTGVGVDPWLVFQQQQGGQGGGRK